MGRFVFTACAGVYILYGIDIYMFTGAANFVSGRSQTGPFMRAERRAEAPSQEPRGIDEWDQKESEMTTSTKEKTLLSRIWEVLRGAARRLNSALVGPDHLEADRQIRERDEYVFQPREY